MSTSGGAEPAIARLRLADQVYATLRARILRGDLDGHLSVPRLAAEFGLSRSPVREAIQRLVAEGLGIEEVHRGVVVARVGDDELDEVTDLRALIEGYAASRAARRAGADPGLVQALDSALARHERAIAADDRSAVISADMDFHIALAGGPATATARVLVPLLGRAQLLMVAGDLSEWPRLACAEHSRILAAVKQGDAVAARRAARDHIERIRDRHRSRP